MLFLLHPSTFLCCTIDEYWYQYRTQPFCANAAYSLYGTLKGHFTAFNSCTKGTYINSFFTYGGADTLLSALDISTSTVFDDYQYDDDDGNYYTQSNSNAVCYPIEGENGGNNQNNNNGNSGDGDDHLSGMSSTMGCTRDGKFAVATFQGDTCDGNYFLETTDYLRKYNRNINGVKCRQIWNLRRDGNTLNQQERKLEDNQDDNYYYTPASAAEGLLMNSWACNTEIYGKGCPDPYGLKSKYNAVLAAVSNGQSARVAVTNARLKTPLRFLSWMAFIAGTTLLAASYYIKNKERIQSEKLLPCLWADFKEVCRTIPCALGQCCQNFREVFRHFREIRRRRKKSKKTSKKKKKEKKEKKRKKHRKPEGTEGSDAFDMTDTFSNDAGTSPSEVDRHPSLTESQSSRSSWW